MKIQHNYSTFYTNGEVKFHVNSQTTHRRFSEYRLPSKPVGLYYLSLSSLQRVRLLYNVAITCFRIECVVVTWQFYFNCSLCASNASERYYEFHEVPVVNTSRRIRHRTSLGWWVIIGHSALFQNYCFYKARAVACDSHATN